MCAQVGQTALTFAKTDQIRRLLEQQPLAIEIAQKNSELLAAARNGQVNAIQPLLNAAADVNAKDKVTCGAAAGLARN